MKDKIRALREHYRLSQAAFAEICNVSRQTVAKWEKGVTVPRAKALACLCAYFKLDIGYFTEEIADPEVMEGVRRERPLFKEVSVACAVSEADEEDCREEDCSVGAVYGHLHRAKYKLFAALLGVGAFVMAFLSCLCGVVLFSLNGGDLHNNSYGWGLGHFCIFVVLAVLLIAATVAMIAAIRRESKRIE